MNEFATFFRDNGADILQHTNDHLALVVIAMFIAIAAGVPLGIAAARRPILARFIIAIANVMQTVPSLALFAFLLPICGLGAPNAIVALVAYSMLPLIRNTVTGIQGVDPHVREAAVAMGMTESQVLRQVEMPLAASVILAGVRTATVLCIGITTIATFIGAGGLGDFIQNGLQGNDNAQTCAGAVPAALLALAADGVLGAIQTSLEVRRSGKTMAQRRLVLVPAGIILLLGAAGALSGASSLFGGARSAVEPGQAGSLIVCAKDFTESKILAELLAQMAEKRGVAVTRKAALAGNNCHNAILAGHIDCFPEYTGTAYTDILHHPPITDVAKVYRQVKQDYAKKQLEVSPPLGFSNGFAMLIRGEVAESLKLKTLSDAIPHARKWVFGCGPQFITRKDGYPGLVKSYGFNFAGPPKSVDLSLLNRALVAHKVDMVAGNETDGMIPTLRLFQLEDDRHYFPPYQGIFVCRKATLEQSTVLAALFPKLANILTTDDMRQLNYEVDGRKFKIPDVAREWVKRHDR